MFIIGHDIIDLCARTLSFDGAKKWNMKTMDVLSEVSAS